MDDENQRRRMTRRFVLAGMGGWLATGLGCFSDDAVNSGSRSPDVDASGAGGQSQGGSGSIDIAPAADGASAGSTDAGNPLEDATGAESPDAFAEAGLSQVIDCHTHFFDPTRATPAGRNAPVPWPDPGSVLYRRTMPPDYEQLAAPLGITGMVVIEASSWLEDNQWILDLAATSSSIVAFVGNLSEVIGKSGFDTAFARYVQNPLFRGIRVSPGTLAGNMSNFIALADKGLMIDVLGSPADLMTIAAFAAKVPKLRIVIDHVGGVSIDGKAPPASWVTGMQAAAAQPNVFCKVSNLVEATGSTNGNASSDVAFYRPVLDTLWAAFGEDRLVFGTNWPVSSPAAPLSTVVSIVKTYFMQKGATATEKYFYRNGKSAYGFAV
jgi:predicted TIM-barrel fold metal-dependent hydrolase